MSRSATIALWLLRTFWTLRSLRSLWPIRSLYPVRKLSPCILFVYLAVLELLCPNVAPQVIERMSDVADDWAELEAEFFRDVAPSHSVIPQGPDPLQGGVEIRIIRGVSFHQLIR